MKNCRVPFRASVCPVLCLFVFGAVLPVLAQTRGDAGLADITRRTAEKRVPSGFVRGECDTGENVEVEATGGTPQTGYATLGEAFMAINTGVHTGDIAIEICGDTTEAGPAVLNSSGAGAADYSAIQIYPLIDNAVISATTGQGRGVIELNGADNVTIDGDNPATEGTNRNLTITNTSAATTTYTSVIRLVTSSAVTSVDDVTIRNLNLSGSALGRNVSSGSSTNTSTNTTFGIFVGGRGPADVTDDPLPINGIGLNNTANMINASATANNFVSENNALINCARAILFWGRHTDRSNSVIVRSNEIGNPTAGDPNGVYSMGVSVQGSLSILVTMNIVYVESYLDTAIRGIEIGPEAFNLAYGTIVVEKNDVRRVRSNSGATYGAYGISVSSGTGHVIRNNFVSGVINSNRGGNPSLGLGRAAVGIRIGSGNNHSVFHNSVHMYGAIDAGAAGENLTAAVGIEGNVQTGISISNNILSNQITGGVSGATFHVVVQLPYTTIASSRNLSINNNAYYVGSSIYSLLAKRGDIALPDSADLYSLSNFDPNSTTPATNFRNLTSRLGNTSNDNASFATTSAPRFVSDSDLHIPTAYMTQLESGGADVGVLEDIDGDARTTTPDIGADEITAPSAAPATLSGRVVSSGLRPLNGARITIIGGNLIQPRSVMVNGFGYYRFEGLEAGQTYIVSVSARGAVFADPIRVVSLDTDLTGLDFYALP